MDSDIDFPDTWKHIPTYSMDDGPSITVAWAIPIEAQSAGARLEAYAAERAIETFKVCIKDAHADRALARVPMEISEMIATQSRQYTFDERQKWWQDAVRCCAINCDCGDNEEHRNRVERLMAKVGERYPCSEKENFDKCRQVQN